jgi:endonuclease-3
MDLNINKIFETFSKENPNPKTELDYTNNFTLLIAVVLSAQATDKRVNIVTKTLFEKYDTPEKIITLGLEGLKDYIKSINYYNTKAKNIMLLSQILIDQYHSVIPDSLHALTTLPGVGRKTANVVLNCAFGIATIPVDTHILRVAKRIGFSTNNIPDKVEQDLIKIIPQKWLDYAHHWLVLHGRYICKARKPMCEICPIRDYCKHYTLVRKI